MGSLPTTKGGNVVLKEVSTPSYVVPGESMTAEIRVKNRAIVINPFDGDRCNSPAAGYKMRAGYVTPSGETKYTNEKCVPGDFSNHTWSVSLTAPEDAGSHDFEAWIEMTGSGKTTDTLTQSISVTSTPPETPDDDNNGGSDPNGLTPLGDADGDGIPNMMDPAPQNPDKPAGGGLPSLGLSTTQQAGLAIVAVLVVMMIARPYASLGSEVMG